ncbi:MAG: hypothetical protein ACQEWG_12690 [Bacteroidota bacterium]
MSVVRWIFGSIFRTLFKKPKFSFKEYLSGPKKSGWFDEHAHGTNNVIVGVLFTIAAIFLIVILI